MIIKKLAHVWVWWPMPVILIIWEARSEESQFKVSPGKNFMRLHLNRKSRV
jgi:hypothetical protein